MPARITLAKKAAEAVVKQAPKATSRISETTRNLVERAGEAMQTVVENRRRRSSNQEGPYLDADELNAARQIEREGGKASLIIDRDGVVRAKEVPGSRKPATYKKGGAVVKTKEKPGSKKPVTYKKGTAAVKTRRKRD